MSTSASINAWATPDPATHTPHAALTVYETDELPETHDAIDAEGTSSANGGAPAHGKAAKRYGIAAAACALFALIYAQFSHGVYSPFMTFMFAIPLIGGFVPSVALALLKAKPLPRLSRQAWALTLASATVASCLRGIFDIAGTASPYLPIYLVAALLFAVIALVGIIHGRQAGRG